VATYSRTVYVGNIGYCTTDRQIYEFFSRVGPVEVVHMGLNRIVSRWFRARFAVCMTVLARICEKLNGSSRT
jgi:RNA recognition motif-containing protein